jgi:spore coat protein U-like protein
MLEFSRSAARAAGIGSFALVAACLPAAVAAQTANSTLNVSATVTANCTVSTSALAFGNVNTLSGSNVDGAGGISVTCTNGTDWSASAGVGSGAGADFTARQMTAGADLLSYNLYTDASRSTVWGDGTGATSTIDDTGTGSVQNVSIYGRVGSGQTSAPAGSYADTVAVTVTY